MCRFCNELFLKDIFEIDFLNFVLYKVYCYKILKFLFEILVNCEYFEDKCEMWRKRYI